MCLVQIIFVVVGLKQKCLGLQQMCMNNGTCEDNIEGLGWEMYVARCLHTIHNIEESHFG